MRSLLFLFLTFFLFSSGVMAEKDSVSVVSDTVVKDTAVAVSATTVKNNGDQPSLLTGNTHQVVSTDMGSGFSLTSLLRGLLGMAVLILISWLFSTNRRAISWKVVFTGLFIQVLLAVSILYVPVIRMAFEIYENNYKEMVKR